MRCSGVNCVVLGDCLILCWCSGSRVRVHWSSSGAGGVGNLLAAQSMSSVSRALGLDKGFLLNPESAALHQQVLINRWNQTRDLQGQIQMKVLERLCGVTLLHLHILSCICNLDTVSQIKWCETFPNTNQRLFIIYFSSLYCNFIQHTYDWFGCAKHYIFNIFAF